VWLEAEPSASSCASRPAQVELKQGHKPFDDDEAIKKDVELAVDYFRQLRGYL
jgi:hypothetical protein